MINSCHSPRKFKANSAILSLLFNLFLGSCYYGTLDPIDRQTGLSREEFRKTMMGDKSKKDKKDNSSTDVPLPKVSRMIAVPIPPSVGGEKLISFSVTEQVPLKDVLIELGRISKIDVDIDPTIAGGVIINAKNRPLKEIIDRISNLGNLRYSYENNVLHFERDLSYNKNYVVDYLISDSLWDEVSSNLGKIVSATDGTGGNASVSVNKVAGIISVYANSKKQKEAELYLAWVRKNFSAQVLIEAKVLEVTLKDNYKTGINWNRGESTVKTGGFSNADGTNAAISYVDPGGTLFGRSISLSVSALEEFGSVRAIASPRINALNNQKANLNFTNQLIYFTVQIQTNTAVGTTGAAGASQTTITSTKHDENIGTELEITPSIDLKNNEITLNVHPKLSTQGKDALDPATVVDNTNPENPVTIQNKIPQINTRELTTTMKVKSGGTLVIGGLMKEDTNNTDTGIPYISKIPVLGNLFKTVTKNTEVVETVIFIKATIINSSNGVDKYDREKHDKFDTSKRSLFN